MPDRPGGPWSILLELLVFDQIVERLQERIILPLLICGELVEQAGNGEQQLDACHGALHLRRQRSRLYDPS